MISRCAVGGVCMWRGIVTTAHCQVANDHSLLLLLVVCACGIEATAPGDVPNG